MDRFRFNMYRLHRHGFGFNMDGFRLENRLRCELKGWDGRNLWNNRSGLECGGCDFTHVRHWNLRLENGFWDWVGLNGLNVNRLENRFWLEGRGNGGFFLVERIEVQIENCIVELVVRGNGGGSRKRFGFKRRHGWRGLWHGGWIKRWRHERGRLERWNRIKIWHGWRGWCTAQQGAEVHTLFCQ